LFTGVPPLGESAGRDIFEGRGFGGDGRHGLAIRRLAVGWLD
jgi:hypothetical protein